MRILSFIALLSICVSSNVFAQSLKEQIDAQSQQYSAGPMTEMKKDFKIGIDEVASSGVLQSALKVGDIAPKFTLVNAAGDNVSLEEKLKGGPVVVTWYRGVWCPYCSLALNAYQKYLPQMNKLGATFIAISPQTPDNTLTTQQKNELEYEVVSDPGNKVAESFGVAYTLPDRVKKYFEGKMDLPIYNGDDSWTLPLTATYIIGQNGKITYAFITPDYKDRADPEKIIEEIKRLK